MSSSQKIVLVGPPNSGKTTLFNWLTGFQNKTINYPGSTVFLSSGHLHKKYELSLQLTDTPGVYSLFPKSSDEEITTDYLLKYGQEVQEVILTLDASKLEIQMPLFFQLKEMGFKIVIALTMWDLIPNNELDIKKLEQKLGVPIVLINGLIGGGVCDLVEQISSSLSSSSSSIQKIKPWTRENLNQAIEKSKNIYESVSQNKFKRASFFVSEKFDKFFLHPKKGLAFFGVVMFLLFSSLFWLADPFMGYVDEFFSFLVDRVHQFNPNSLSIDFLAHGVIGSIGAVLVFVPQIFILFVGIAVLEDTGYLARAVSLMDGLFSKIGLSGRSFVPFLSGYACAIPAIMVARNISSPREKTLSFFAIPFMSCSARLPVYALLLSFLFYGQSAWKPGLVLSVIYIGSFVLGILAVYLLNKWLKPDRRKKPFILDLPLYRRPLWIKVFQSAWKRTENYIIKAGPAIFIVALVVWFITNFPRDLSLSPPEQIQNSYAGQIGRIIEPFFELMGVDWRVGVGLIAAFAAREVFVSSLVLVFNLTSTEDTITGSLIENMKTAVNSSGEAVFSLASVIGLIVFFMFSLQCVSTTALVYKESGSFKLATLQFIILNVLAYIMAVLVYQVLSFS